ncbi:MAG: hypothetical protein FWC28_01255, partial [Proteobacteria bacterium]|nr:hypothetical protein [Pseudomonadota bacterium]
MRHFILPSSSPLAIRAGTCSFLARASMAAGVIAWRTRCLTGGESARGPGEGSSSILGREGLDILGREGLDILGREGLDILGREGLDVLGEEG